MEKVEQMITTYHIFFVCCLVAMVLFLVIALIMFFGWKIWPAINILTGRGAAKAAAHPERRDSKPMKKKESKQKPAPVTPMPRQITRTEVLGEEGRNKTQVLIDPDKTLQLENPGTCLLATPTPIEPIPESVPMPDVIVPMNILDLVMAVHSQERIS